MAKLIFSSFCIYFGTNEFDEGKILYHFLIRKFGVFEILYNVGEMSQMLGNNFRLLVVTDIIDYGTPRTLNKYECSLRKQFNIVV